MSPAVKLFCDILLPGDGEWPAASAALTGLELAPADHAWIQRWAPDITACPAERRIAAMAALESREPTAFARVLAALYGAYYTAPSVHAAVRRLAESGPRAPSPHFDMALLEQVIGTRTGKPRPGGLSA